MKWGGWMNGRREDETKMGPKKLRFLISTKAGEIESY